MTLDTKYFLKAGVCVLLALVACIFVFATGCWLLGLGEFDLLTAFRVCLGLSLCLVAFFGAIATFAVVTDGC